MLFVGENKKTATTRGKGKGGMGRGWWGDSNAPAAAASLHARTHTHSHTRSLDPCLLACLPARGDPVVISPISTITVVRTTCSGRTTGLARLCEESMSQQLIIIIISSIILSNNLLFESYVLKVFCTTICFYAVRIRTDWGGMEYHVSWFPVSDTETGAANGGIFIP